MSNFPFTATACATAFLNGDVSATEIADASLQRIAHQNAALNAFVEVTGERALTEAKLLDSARQYGRQLSPFSAVPYAVKNLFDIKGVTTLAGAKIHTQNPPAKQDAMLVERLASAGGILTGTLNMDAYAYGFTTENTHYGATHNPHDLARSAGGSSGGTGAAVAAGLVPIGLGSDTNGSIRVPSSLCGTFGLKPTFGRLSRSGTLPFVASLDHLGPMATTSQDLALAYDVMQGPDPMDHACAQKKIREISGELSRGVEGLRIARLAGYFDENAGTDARWAAQAVAKALGTGVALELPGVAQARAAAYLMTASESGALYLDAMRKNIEDFEPHSVERLIAGSLVPTVWYQRALRYRQLFLKRVLAVFEHHDLLIAPATPVTAPLLGQQFIRIGVRDLPTRPNMGLLTQPISFVGLPVTVVPLWTESGLPVGVQLIAPPWREDLCLRAAYELEKMGIAFSKIPGGKI